jgi:hypothetical protein
MNTNDLKKLPESKSDPCTSDDGKECCFLIQDKSCAPYMITCVKEKIVYVKE